MTDVFSKFSFWLALCADCEKSIQPLPDFNYKAWAVCHACGKERTCAHKAYSTREEVASILAKATSVEEWTKQYELLYTEADRLWQLWLDEIKATPNAIEQMAELMESPRFKDALAAHEKSSQFYREHVR